MTTIPATTGAPYIITRTGSLIRLERTVPPGRPVHLIFAAEDAVRVADALVDCVEGMQ